LAAKIKRVKYNVPCTIDVTNNVIRFVGSDEIREIPITANTPSLQLNGEIIGILYPESINKQSIRDIPIYTSNNAFQIQSETIYLDILQDPIPMPLKSKHILYELPYSKGYYVYIHFRSKIIDLVKNNFIDDLLELTEKYDKDNIEKTKIENLTFKVFNFDKKDISNLAEKYSLFLEPREQMYLPIVSNKFSTAQLISNKPLINFYTIQTRKNKIYFFTDEEIELFITNHDLYHYIFPGNSLIELYIKSASQLDYEIMIRKNKGVDIE